jgi:ubiquinone/menaquinone biosynthesis C-methylase UbiE
MNADVKKFTRFCDSEFGKRVMEKETWYIYNELKGYKKILDVGCGIGSFEQNLPSLETIGLDSSREMLEEAKKRSDKAFVLGNAEHLGFKDSTFDAVFAVTTLEFIDNYQKVIEEMARVTKPCGKVLVMMLNPKSEYFREKVEKPDAYFRRIKHTNPREVRNYISRFYSVIEEEKFLGIKGQHIFDTNDERYAGLYVVVGIKR